MIGLITERPETITIGTNELIGTDPSKLPVPYTPPYAWRKRMIQAMRKAGL